MKTLIAIPCMDTVNSLFMRSLLNLKKTGEVEHALAIGSLIYDARNMLALKAMNEGFDRVLWLDSDMIFDPDLMERLNKRLDEGKDYVTGMYFTRKSPFEPVVYKSVGMRGDQPARIPFGDYPEGLFEIAGSGMGAVMVKASLLKQVTAKYGLPFSPILGFGEDLSFCLRVTEIGKKMWCDSTVKLGHVGYIAVTENTYKKIKGAK